MYLLKYYWILLRWYIVLCKVRGRGRPRSKRTESCFTLVLLIIIIYLEHKYEMLTSSLLVWYVLIIILFRKKTEKKLSKYWTWTESEQINHLPCFSLAVFNVIVLLSHFLLVLSLTSAIFSAIPWSICVNSYFAWFFWYV